MSKKDATEDGAKGEWGKVLDVKRSVSPSLASFKK